MRFFPFGCIWDRFLLHKTRCKIGQHGAINAKFVPQSLVRISWNGRSRSTQLGPKLMFSCVSFRLGAFGTIMLLHKLNAKRAKLVQLMPKFVPRCLVRNFRNERSRSTPLEPKLMFCCVSFYLGAFETIWLQHKTRCKMGQPGTIKAKVCATKSCQNFSKRTLLIHIIGS